jgi:hypothetical protein
VLCRSGLEAYRELLARADPFLQQQREQDRLRPPHFNIFQALGHAYREVSTHSAMLAHLLDPAASHAQGVLFLAGFLDLVQGAADSQKKNLRLQRPESVAHLWRIRKEVPLPDGLGQADVLVQGPGLLLLIENKIFAGDLENQLQRYWTFAKAQAEAQSLLPLIIYLTPDGRPPPALSIGGSTGLDEKLVLLSYHDDIYHWIQRKTAELHAISVAEVLRQYAALVRNLT